jgi:hypothetical protein
VWGDDARIDPAVAEPETLQGVYLERLLVWVASCSLRLSLFDFGILVGLLGLFGVLKLRT